MIWMHSYEFKNLSLVREYQVFGKVLEVVGGKVGENRRFFAGD